jgi:hypothetical protein
MTSFGTSGTGPMQLQRPCGLDITANGTVVVTDPGNKRLQLFGAISTTSANDNIISESDRLVSNITGEEAVQF